MSSVLEKSLAIVELLVDHPTGLKSRRCRAGG